MLTVQRYSRNAGVTNKTEGSEDHPTAADLNWAGNGMRKWCEGFLDSHPKTRVPSLPLPLRSPLLRPLATTASTSAMLP